jgi:hypothetical protein
MVAVKKYCRVLRVMLMTMNNKTNNKTKNERKKTAKNKKKKRRRQACTNSLVWDLNLKKGGVKEK